MTSLQGDPPDLLQVRVPVATVWTDPGAPRDVDAPAVADRPDVAAWTASMGREARRGLVGRTSTQLLMGDPVRVLDTRGDWVRVACLTQRSSAGAEGYPGWVRRAHLDAPADPAGRPSATVATRSATLTMAGSGGAEVVELSFGTRLPVEGSGRDQVTVLLPGSRRGRLASNTVRPRLGEVRPARGPEDGLRTARQFLGLRYLWGGTSAWGLDCSGLVHLSFRALDVQVPRDAFDQAEGPHLDPVPLDDVEPGDLYFFSRAGERIHHVGFVSRAVAEDGTRHMLHAPEGGGLVEDAPLPPHRAGTLVAAGRVRTRPAEQAPSPGGHRADQA